MNNAAFLIAILGPALINVAMIPVYVKGHRERVERRRAAVSA